MIKQLLSLTLLTMPLVGHEFTDLIDKRHSGYEFDAARDVSTTDLEKMIKAAESAPSSYNDQPWRYIIASKEKHPEAYQKIMSSLVEFNQNWAKNAPVLVVVAADTQLTKNDKPNGWGLYDSGASAAFFVLKATDLGLMTHQMGGFDPVKITQAFNIPSRYQPISVIALGYEKQGAEQKEKVRRPTESQFFFGKWGK